MGKEGVRFRSKRDQVAAVATVVSLGIIVAVLRLFFPLEMEKKE